MGRFIKHGCPYIRKEPTKEDLYDTAKRSIHRRQPDVQIQRLFARQRLEQTAKNIQRNWCNHKFLDPQSG